MGTLSKEKDWLLSALGAVFAAGGVFAVGVAVGGGVGVCAGLVADTAGLDGGAEGGAVFSAAGVEAGLVAAGPVPGAWAGFLMPGPETPVVRSGAPQRGQDLLDQEPRLEPQEVQNM